MKNRESFVRTSARLFRRYWIPVLVFALLSIVFLSGQPAWAADNDPAIGQTVPTPTPTAPEVAPTAVPAPTPDNGGGGSDTGSDTGGGDSSADTSAGSDAPAVVEDAAAAPVAEVAAVEALTSTVTLTGTVTAVTLNVRQGPGTTFPVIGRLTAGTVVNVLARNLDGAWLLICCTPSGSNGWVSAEFIAPSFSAAEAAGLGVTNSEVTTTTVTSTVTGTVAAAATPLSGNGTVDVLTLNVRQGPSTTTPVVGRFRQGDTFTIQGANEAGDWYLVCCIPNTQNAGWISAQFVTLNDSAGDAATTDSATDTAAPDAADGAKTPEPATPVEPADTSDSDSTSGVSDVLW